MGAICTKKQSFAKDCAKLIEVTNLANILKQEHSQILKQKVFDFPSIVMKPENCLKRKDCNTFRSDRNRVFLPTNDGESELINASHVDGHNTSGRFLCTQAPLQETAQDFWKMVFAYKVRIIVMLTKTVEDGVEVCYPYWNPKKGAKVVHGKFTIKTLKIKTFRYHVVTSLRVTEASGASLDVKHFAYTDWPRKSVPRDPLKFLKFVLSVREAQLEAECDSKGGNFPPMVVHCSDGFNRTGAFCAIDICLSEYDQRATINLFLVVRDLRKQIYNCLCLSEHYLFCYLTVLLYVKLSADVI